MGAILEYFIHVSPNILYVSCSFQSLNILQVYKHTQSFYKYACVRSNYVKKKSSMYYL